MDRGLFGQPIRCDTRAGWKSSGTEPEQMFVFSRILSAKRQNTHEDLFDLLPRGWQNTAVVKTAESLLYWIKPLMLQADGQPGFETLLGSVRLSEIYAVVLRTTPNGPLYPDCFWDIYDTESSVMLEGSLLHRPLIVPFEPTIEGTSDVYDYFSGLKGARQQSIISAMSSTSHAAFLVWADWALAKRAIAAPGPDMMEKLARRTHYLYRPFYLAQTNQPALQTPESSDPIPGELFANFHQAARSDA